MCNYHVSIKNKNTFLEKHMPILNPLKAERWGRRERRKEGGRDKGRKEGRRWV
jgi:hypothetical protein